MVIISSIDILLFKVFTTIINLLKHNEVQSQNLSKTSTIFFDNDTFHVKKIIQDFW